MPLPAVQAAFQAGGGLPRLVALLDTAVSPKLGEHRAGIVSGAIDALAAMTRNSAPARCVHRLMAGMPLHPGHRRVAMPKRMPGSDTGARITGGKRLLRAPYRPCAARWARATTSRCRSRSSTKNKKKSRLTPVVRDLPG